VAPSWLAGGADGAAVAGAGADKGELAVDATRVAGAGRVAAGAETAAPSVLTPVLPPFAEVAGAVGAAVASGDAWAPAYGAGAVTLDAAARPGR
jgi:hypothetical protein